MAITPVGSSSAAGNSVALPAHLPGDLIFIHTYRVTGTGAPVLVDGYTNINSGAIGTTGADRIAYKIATSNAEVSGTWTNAEAILATVYRGADQTTPTGNFAIDTNSGAAGTQYPALTTQDTTGKSWIVEFAGVRAANQSVQTPPAGMTNRASQIIGSGQSATHDSNGGVTSIAVAKAGGTGFRYRTYAIEIKAAADAAPAPISGTTTVTTEDALGTSKAALIVKGKSSSQTEDATIVAYGKLRISAMAVATTEDAIAAAVGKSPVRGQASFITEDAIAVSSAKLSIRGTVVVTAEDATAIAYGDVVSPIKATASATTEDAVVVACGRLTVKAIVSVHTEDAIGISRGSLLSDKLPYYIVPEGFRIKLGFRHYKFRRA